MKHRIYQVDAFADKVFTGNPAAVCPLSGWLPDDLLLNIAAENNLSETAFYVKDGDGFQIRWFTPKAEVDLCGHATLAAAFVLFNHEDFGGDLIRFYSRKSGVLTVHKEGELLTLDFPADPCVEVDLTSEMLDCFNIRPEMAFMGKTDLMLVFKNEDQIRALIPAFDRIAALDARGLIVTAEGDDTDFVSRFFAPRVGVMEDPVTGSAHTTLTPYWSNRLVKLDMKAVQLSERKGFLNCSLSDERVLLSGKAVLYLEGTIHLERNSI